MTTYSDLIKYAEDTSILRRIDDKPIYSILLLEYSNRPHMVVNSSGEEVPSGFPDTGDRHDVGFYYDLKTAIEVLNSNCCDIQEGCYTAAFILCRFQGLYAGCSQQERMYFVWDAERKGFFQQEEPEIFLHIAY